MTVQDAQDAANGSRNLGQNRSEYKDQIHILFVGSDLDEVACIGRALRKANIVYGLHVVGNVVEAGTYLLRETPYLGAPTPNLVLLSAGLPDSNRAEILTGLQSCQKFTGVEVVQLADSDLPVGSVGIDAGATGLYNQEECGNTRLIRKLMTERRVS